MILNGVFENLIELTEKWPDLEHGFQDAWVADELIKNIVVNARGNHSKIYHCNEGACSESSNDRPPATEESSTTMERTSENEEDTVEPMINDIANERNLPSVVRMKKRAVTKVTIDGPGPAPKKHQTNATLHDATIPTAGPSTFPIPRPSTIPRPGLSVIPIPGPLMIPTARPSTIPRPRLSMISIPGPPMIPIPRPSTISIRRPSTVPIPGPSTRAQPKPRPKRSAKP